MFGKKLRQSTLISSRRKTERKKLTSVLSTGGASPTTERGGVVDHGGAEEEVQRGGREQETKRCSHLDRGEEMSTMRRDSLRGKQCCVAYCCSQQQRSEYAGGNGAW